MSAVPKDDAACIGDKASARKGVFYKLFRLECKRFVPVDACNPGAVHIRAGKHLPFQKRPLWIFTPRTFRFQPRRTAEGGLPPVRILLYIQRFEVWFKMVNGYVDYLGRLDCIGLVFGHITIYRLKPGCCRFLQFKWPATGRLFKVEQVNFECFC